MAVCERPPIETRNRKMKREDFLKAFAEMSPEDQASIRAELVGKAAQQGAWDLTAVCHEMMQKMKCC